MGWYLIMNSKLKTALKRNKFKGEGVRGKRKPMRESNGYLVRGNKRFRIRPIAGLVDICDDAQDFDRWANSTSRTISLDEFCKEFLK